ncbi:transcriptional regulator [Solemya velum gill symbiont]|uniref:UPF0301 protein JV46_15820 n=1 Tax=Solemya velum gill symbiont TaxID=2340 RepID=A0A0B0H8W7_SOVGS|nr:YqgE/AlgH family protein [Solemya velum gill symbiont]KHF25545.1 transcriptional regulator [Solemya velum gill symbiont]
MNKLTDHFLIAMPGLMDQNFFQSVTYIVEHSEDGAMGIVINHPLEITLEEMFGQLKIEASPGTKALGNSLYLGGPVQEDRGFVLHDGDAVTWASSLQIEKALCVTTSKDILEAIAQGNGPRNSLVALGYAGWAAGQLEREISENSWLSGRADKDIIFNLPVEKRWSAAEQLIGVDISLLSSEAGHA